MILCNHNLPTLVLNTWNMFHAHDLITPSFALIRSSYGQLTIITLYGRCQRIRLKSKIVTEAWTAVMGAWPDDSLCMGKHDFEWNYLVFPVLRKKSFMILLNLKHKAHQNPKLNCCLSRLAVVVAQPIEARCQVENEDVVGAAPTGAASTTSK